MLSASSPEFDALKKNLKKILHRRKILASSSVYAIRTEAKWCLEVMKQIITFATVRKNTPCRQGLSELG